MEIKELFDALSGPQWWLSLIVIFVYLVDKFSLMRWLTSNRVKEELQLVRDLLKDADNLSPHMIEHLHLELDRLTLQATKGISRESSMVPHFIRLSDNQPGGIPWATLRHAQRFLFLTGERLEVRIKRSDKLTRVLSWLS